MANEVTYKVRAEILTSGEERLESTKKSLEDIQNLNKGTASETHSIDNSQKSYTKDTRLYLKEMDSLTKGFAMLAKSIESPITLFGMLRETLFDKALATAEKADMLQMSKDRRETQRGKLQNEEPRKENQPENNKYERSDNQQRLSIPNDLKNIFRNISRNAGETTQMSEGQQRLPNTAKAMQETANIGGKVASSAAKGGSASSMASLGKVLGAASKALGVFGAVVGVAAIAIGGIDKALKKMNQQIMAAGERMAMLAETGNVAGANLDEYDNSFKGAFLSSIPIIGALVRKNLVQDYANWTAFQPFAKLIPSLLDYKYSTGSSGSGADMAKKVTDETGLETGYDFATRFKVLGAMSEYVGKSNDAAVTRELLSSSRALGLNPDMLVDLVGNAVRYNTDNFKTDDNAVMTSIEKTAMDTGLDRSRYKELIRGFDDIIKKQLSVGVKVSVANVSEMASVLGQAGDVWKGERGLHIQMSMNERLRNAGNLTSDEDVALMQWTRGKDESYHDWRLEMDKGLTKERFATMAQRFTTETGNDIVTGNNMLANTFGISYTQADELRQLMTKMNDHSLNDTDREDARKSFQEKMNEIREGERPQELAYLEKINTTMENATVDASGKLGSILEILQNWQNRDAPPDPLEEIKEEIDSHDLVAQIQNKTGEIGDLLIEQNIKNEVTPFWEDDLFNKFDKNNDRVLDNEEMQEYGKYLDKIIDALKSLESLELIQKLLEGGMIID